MADYWNEILHTWEQDMKQEEKIGKMEQRVVAVQASRGAWLPAGIPS